ncbi:MAG: formylglycine-generating enzyme family protein [Gammaproteobacteria bacterium]|nr:formylglycine-generating enzyme family protein [Gammaproteobacteria bacterium]
MTTTSSRRVRRYSGVLCLALAVLMSRAAVAVDLSKCGRCHAAPPVTVTAGPACVSCHSAEQDLAEDSAPAFTQALDAEPTEKPLDAAALKPRPALDSTELLPGMRVPLYYEHTRIGTHPNEMVHIPAGPFTMGTDERLPDEGPAHIVDLPAYDIDMYEVTNGQYKAFMDATRHRSPPQFENRTWPAGKVDHPVVGVTWNDAHDYCEWAGKRLPTDEEWEKAARGTDARRYPWGDGFGMTRANTPLYWNSQQREGDTSPVGAFAEGVSAYGLYDMTGNVWEWTESWYRAYPGNTHPNENYGEHYKTLKGGSWWDCSFYKCGISAPSFNRSFFLKTTKNNSFGFRCAKDAH